MGAGRKGNEPGMAGKDLDSLLSGLPVISKTGGNGIVVCGITADSRKVRPGDLFICIPGEKYDGHAFIGEAIARGAAAIVGQGDYAAAPGIPYVRLPDTRRAAGSIAAEFYGHPSRQLRVVGVTGTNGKTTTAFLSEAILQSAGHKVGLAGTVMNRYDGSKTAAERTTPEGIDLQAFCRRVADAGGEYLVMEVSSHSIELHRVDSIEYDVGVFTNLTQDHLDYHKTMGNYLKAKTKLFEGLTVRPDSAPRKRRKGAVINLDDPVSRHIRQHTTVPALTYGLRTPADIRAERVRMTTDGLRYVAVTPQGRAEMILQITGRFNVYNSLAAIGVGLTEGVALPQIKAALAAFGGVPGRFERIDAGQDFTVIVDYAHTPDGLEQVLVAAREFTRKRLILVFGCSGERDRTKRPIMGEIAARLSDYCIVTADNPSSEDPENINREVEAGVRKHTAEYSLQTDRRVAVEQALAMARPGDLVLLAGKGHETYQVLKHETVPYEERRVAREILTQMKRNGLSPDR